MIETIPHTLTATPTETPCPWSFEVLPARPDDPKIIRATFRQAADLDWTRDMLADPQRWLDYQMRLAGHVLPSTLDVTLTRYGPGTRGPHRVEGLILIDLATGRASICVHRLTHPRSAG